SILRTNESRFDIGANFQVRNFPAGTSPSIVTPLGNCLIGAPDQDSRRTSPRMRIRSPVFAFTKASWTRRKEEEVGLLPVSTTSGRGPAGSTMLGAEELSFGFLGPNRPSAKPTPAMIAAIMSPPVSTQSHRVLGAFGPPEPAPGQGALAVR